MYVLSKLKKVVLIGAVMAENPIKGFYRAYL